MTFRPGGVYPPTMSQALVASSAPSISPANGMPPVAMMTTSGSSSRTEDASRERPRSYVHPEPGEFRDAPVDHADDIASPVGAGCQQHLATRTGCSFKDGDGVTALRRHPGGLEAGRPGPRPPRASCEPGPCR